LVNVVIKIIKDKNWGKILSEKGYYKVQKHFNIEETIRNLVELFPKIRYQ